MTRLIHLELFTDFFNKIGPKRRRSHQCLGLLIEPFETRSEIARWNSVEKSVDGR